jgi:hypothetical protein
MSRDFESRYVSTGRFDDWFLRAFPSRLQRITAKLVIVAVVYALVGYAGGMLFDRAAGATRDLPLRVAAARACDPDVSLPCSVGVNVTSFRQGELGRSQGYRGQLDTVYRRPAVAKRVWVRKISRAIEKENAQREEQGIAPRYIPSDARSLYLHNTRAASCSTAGNYPAIASGKRTCNGYRVADLNNGPGLTKRQIQIAGSVILCGAGVALGVVAAGPSAGSSTALVAGTGAVSCLWSFWAAVDPG